MSLSLADEYYLRALDNYDVSISEIVEPLNYALSYDEEHVPSLCLLARLKMDYFKDYGAAKHYFELALMIQPNYVDIYKYYIKLLLWLGELSKAETILYKSGKIKGLSNSTRYQLWSNYYECKGRPDLAIKEMAKARLFSINSQSYNFYKLEQARLKLKICKSSSKRKKSNKSKVRK